MRKGLLGVALIGCGAIVVLSMLATHYLGNTPKIAELRYIRELLATDGRLVRLYYAPSPPFPKAGTAGHGLRLIYKFQHGPAHGTLQQQANRLGDSIFRQWTGDPELAFVECSHRSRPATRPPPPRLREAAAETDVSGPPWPELTLALSPQGVRSPRLARPRGSR